MNPITILKKEHLSHKDACEFFNIVPQTLYNWVYQGKLRSVKFGKMSWYRKKDIEKLVSKMSK